MTGKGGSIYPASDHKIVAMDCKPDADATFSGSLKKKNMAPPPPYRTNHLHHIGPITKPGFVSEFAFQSNRFMDLDHQEIEESIYQLSELSVRMVFDI